MFSSYCTLHPALHRKLIDIRDVWARPGTMWAHFVSSGMPSMSRLHVCLYLSSDLSGRLMDICLLAYFTLFTVFPGRKKYPVFPASAMASCFVICIIDVI